MSRVVLAVGLAGAVALGACGGGNGAPASVGMPAPPPGDAGVSTPRADGVPVAKGAGCGKALPLDQPTNGAPTGPDGLPGFRPFSVTLTGHSLDVPVRGQSATREFSVRVPLDYDPDRAYRTVYIAGACGASSDDRAYELWDASLGGTDQAIYVVIQPPVFDLGDGMPLDCFDVDTGRGSQEWEAFAAINAVVDQSYCVDGNRIYVVGDGPGAKLAAMWGCYFGGDGQHPASDPSAPRAFAPAFHVRGQVGVFGGPAPATPACNGPVAALFLDGEGPVSREDQVRQRVFAMNGCSIVPYGPWQAESAGSPKCFQYTGCPDDYPVVSCLSGGLVTQADMRRQAIRAATLFFDQLNAPDPR